MLARLRKAVSRVANTSKEDLHLLPTLERSLLSLFTASSCLYGYIIVVRWKLYEWGVFKRYRLPLPVVSVGNLSWGGNGKTPMVEYLSWKILKCGIRPLLLTRGYGNGDEVRLLESHLQGTQAIIGAGIDRVKVANAALCEHGMRGICEVLSSIKKLNFQRTFQGPHGQSHFDTHKFVPCDGLHPQISSKKDNTDIVECEDGIGMILLDDGMQHWRLARDFEIIMVNAISSFGNEHLIPRGPLREPLKALHRADIAVIHHANLVAPCEVDHLKKSLQSFLPEFAEIYCTQMMPDSLFHLQKSHRIRNDKVYKTPNSAPLSLLRNSYVLCISGIGCPKSMTLTLQQQGVSFTAQMDFLDHHHFTVKDLVAIKERLSELETKLRHDFVIVTTEKDYARSPEFFWQIEDNDVYVLHSRLEIMNDISAAVDLGSLIALKIRCRRG